MYYATESKDDGLIHHRFPFKFQRDAWLARTMRDEPQRQPRRFPPGPAFYKLVTRATAAECGMSPWLPVEGSSVGHESMDARDLPPAVDRRMRPAPANPRPLPPRHKLRHPMVRLPCLTHRQSQVLAWRHNGQSLTEIAAILNCAPGTVAATLSQVAKKLGFEWPRQAVIHYAGVLQKLKTPGETGE